jgi:hypothetical protein
MEFEMRRRGRPADKEVRKPKRPGMVLFMKKAGKMERD